MTGWSYPDTWLRVFLIIIHTSGTDRVFSVEYFSRVEIVLNSDTVDLFPMSIRWPPLVEAEGAPALMLVTQPRVCQVRRPAWAELSNLDVCFLSKILTKCHARFRQEHLLQPGQTWGQHYLRHYLSLWLMALFRSASTSSQSPHCAFGPARLRSVHRRRTVTRRSGRIRRFRR